MNTSHKAGSRYGLYGITLLVSTIAVGACSPSAPSRSPGAKTTSPPATTTPKKPVAPLRPVFVHPKAVRGIYLTAWSAGSRRKLDHTIALLKRTELNSFVIDVRDDGLNYWKNDIPMAKAAQANRTAVLKPAEVMARLSKEGIYPIARIACFRDNVLPKKRPDLAIKDAATGKTWRDRSGHAWLDPYNKTNWGYIASVVESALDTGFPEIQLDYVRFPSEGKSSTMAFSAKKAYGQPKAQPSEVVAAFAKYVADRVHARNGIVGADIFGVISVNKGDQGIGQMLEAVAEPLDVICPMVYPSHFSKGMYNIANPDTNPYSIVLKSLKDYARRLPKKHVRPWLQDFSLGSKYGVTEVQSQILAARTAGYSEYLLWNASNVYTEAAVVDTSKLALKGPAKAKAPSRLVAKKPTSRSWDRFQAGLSSYPAHALIATTPRPALP